MPIRTIREFFEKMVEYSEAMSSLIDIESELKKASEANVENKEVAELKANKQELEAAIKIMGDERIRG